MCDFNLVNDASINESNRASLNSSSYSMISDFCIEGSVSLRIIEEFAQVYKSGNAILNLYIRDEDNQEEYINGLFSLIDQFSYSRANIRIYTSQEISVSNLIGDSYIYIGSRIPQFDKVVAFCNRNNIPVYEVVDGPLFKCSYPVLILNSGNECYGISISFQHQMIESLISRRYPVISFETLEYKEIVRIACMPGEYEALIGFQDNFFKNDLSKIDSPKLHFWYDNPIFYEDTIREMECIFLCQDKGYSDYIRRHLNKPAFFFPLAGTDIGLSDNEKRPYDISFVGTYTDVDVVNSFSGMKRDFFDYMIENPSLTFEDAVCLYFDVDEDSEMFHSCFEKVRDVCRIIPYYFRDKIIRTIIESGVSMHVFGESWRKMKTDSSDNLIIHEEIQSEEALRIYGNSKISLNIMTWHKHGMTERIANIMLGGAVCISDESSFLVNNFDENEIVLFSVDNIKALPDMIKALINDTDRIKRISERGYKKAKEYHIWDRRVEIIEDSYLRKS